MQKLATAAPKTDQVVVAAPQDPEPRVWTPEEVPATNGADQVPDPLCAECRLRHQDPSPRELVMFLHALRYKGPGFEYSSPMPAWAQDDWQED